MASITTGNRIIPKQCAVIGVTITDYDLFPADTFVDTDGESVSYTALSPWNAFTRQLLTSTGNVKFNSGSRQIYGTPGGDLTGGTEYSNTLTGKSLDGSTTSLSTVWLIGAS